MGSDIVVTKQDLAPVTPMQMIAEASSRADVSIERMAQLFELQLRWEANEAKKAYSTAFAAFKAEAVVIVKNTKVVAGPLSGTKYANLFDVVDAVIPALSKHGLSHSWKLTKDEPTWMEVTCIITHSSGHSESVSMGAAPDTGPGRNAIQARGSAKSYLERYTLLAATGMAAGGEDNDGSGGDDSPKMDEKVFVSWEDAIKNAGNDAELIKIYKAAYKEAFDMGDMVSVKAFEKAKDARKATL